MAGGVAYDLLRSLILLAILAVAATPFPAGIFRKMYEKSWWRWAAAGAAAAVLVLSVAYMIASSYNPFLYFRF